LSAVKEFKETTEDSQDLQEGVLSSSFLFLQEAQLEYLLFLFDLDISQDRMRIRSRIANITSNNIANVLLFIFN